MVLLLDVDFRPSLELSYLMFTQYHTLLQMVYRKFAIVLPAIEATGDKERAEQHATNAVVGETHINSTSCHFILLYKYLHAFWLINIHLQYLLAVLEMKFIFSNGSCLLSITTGGKEVATRLLGEGLLVGFATQYFKKAHEPTNFTKWSTALEPYSVIYKEVCKCCFIHKYSLWMRFGNCRQGHLQVINLQLNLRSF